MHLVRVDRDAHSSDVRVDDVILETNTKIVDERFFALVAVSHDVKGRRHEKMAMCVDERSRKGRISRSSIKRCAAGQSGDEQHVLFEHDRVSDTKHVLSAFCP